MDIYSEIQDSKQTSDVKHHIINFIGESLI